ncbi:MAG: hypothetical protein LBV68_00500, partial [Spirochaetaceae bacterium]|nr:hypothetical protein [Spirochaetaceae bacterium]
MNFLKQTNCQNLSAFLKREHSRRPDGSEQTLSVFPSPAPILHKERRSLFKYICLALFLLICGGFLGAQDQGQSGGESEQNSQSPSDPVSDKSGKEL